MSPRLSGAVRIGTTSARPEVNANDALARAVSSMIRS